MKKIIIVLCLLFVSTSAFAKTKDEFTLQCSYITAKTDFHLTLQPIKFKKNGDAYIGRKYVGKSTRVDDELFLMMEGGTMFSINFKRWLSVYSILVDGSPVYSYGSCQVVE